MKRQEVIQLGCGHGYCGLCVKRNFAAFRCVQCSAGVRVLQCHSPKVTVRMTANETSLLFGGLLSIRLCAVAGVDGMRLRNGGTEVLVSPAGSPGLPEGASDLDHFTVLELDPDTGRRVQVGFVAIKKVWPGQY